MNKRIFEIIGIYEIIGGSIGLILLLFGQLSLNKFTFLGLLMWLIVFGFYGLTVYAGIKLYKKHDKAIMLSEIVQYMQIVSFGLVGYYMAFTSGITAYLGIDYTADLIFKFAFNFNPSGTQLSYLGDKTPFYIYINLIPILVITLMDIGKKRLQKEKLEIESQINNIC